ncbi:MAG: phosphotransferase [Silvibacterium sp.]|nr:phosphotransferase [Silvibacterium sp.]MBV8437386.1 phosphotransferase [Silvibacterium sp.]
MDHLSRRAVAAALVVSRNLGLHCSDAPEVVADSSNVLVHLVPAPVVARVATTTALVRKPARQWLALDLDLAGYLAVRNFPVVPPCRELPAGPHQHDGFALTFWEFIEHDRSYIAAAQEVGPLLRELHSILHGYSGPLRRLSPFAEIPQWLGEVESWNSIDPADIAILRRGFAVISAEIESLHLAEQPLHGDAHKKNVLKTSKGLVWTDFEDACSGPIEWDLACFVRTSLESSQSLWQATVTTWIAPASTPSLLRATSREPPGAPSCPRDSPAARNAQRSGWLSPAPDMVSDIPKRHACSPTRFLPSLCLILHIHPAYAHRYGSYDGACQRLPRQQHRCLLQSHADSR